MYWEIRNWFIPSPVHIKQTPELNGLKYLEIPYYTMVSKGVFNIRGKELTNFHVIHCNTKLMGGCATSKHFF